MLIDIFTPDQQNQVKDFILDVWKEFGLIYIQKFDFDLETIEDFYIKPGGIFYVLKDENKIRGTIGVMNKNDNTAELKRFFVHRDFRGKGYGTELLNKVIKFCKENGFKKIAFETGKEFKQGHKFYKKRGFKIIKEDDKNYYMEILL